VKSKAANAGTNKRVVVIGFDMGDGGLIRKWSQDGYLPNFSSLITKGVWLDLETTASVLHTSTWPTFATGDRPGRHGVYYPYQPMPGHQEAQLIRPDQYGSPTFWSRADRQGLKGIVYDVPETFPEEPFGGRAIFEWGTWAWYGTRASQPAGLLDEIRKRFGQYPLKMEAKRLGLRFPNLKMLERRLLRSIEHKRASFEWLLANNDWDLAVMVFGETHPAGHYFWPAGVAGAPDTEDPSFDSMRQIYVAIDDALGSLRKALPDDATLILVSGDGVTANNCGWHLLPEVLDKLGHTSAPAQEPGANKGVRSAMSLGRIKGLLPNGARRFIADHLPWWLRDKIGASMRSARIDWRNSKAFALPTDLEGCIRINLKDREPNGIVEAGKEYETLCQDIADQMKELVNPATGKPAVGKVWIRNDVFAGPSQEYLPDITVTWNNDAPISALVSKRMGKVEGESPDPRTGTHSANGFCLVSGKEFSQGTTTRGRLIDVAPTVLALLGADWNGMDGRPLRIGPYQNYGDGQTGRVAASGVSGRTA